MLGLTHFHTQKIEENLYLNLQLTRQVHLSLFLSKFRPNTAVEASVEITAYYLSDKTII